MLNIFGALSSLGRLLPGYMQGEQQAVQQNWQDLLQYNQAQAGQLQNLMSEATFQPTVSQAKSAAENAYMNMLLNAMQLNITGAGYPGQLHAAGTYGAMQPALAAILGAGQMRQGLQMALPGYGGAGAINWGQNLFGNLPQQQQQQQVLPPGWGPAPMQQLPAYQTGPVNLPSVVR